MGPELEEEDCCRNTESVRSKKVKSPCSRRNALSSDGVALMAIFGVPEIEKKECLLIPNP